MESFKHVPLPCRHPWAWPLSILATGSRLGPASTPEPVDRGHLPKAASVLSPRDPCLPFFLLSPGRSFQKGGSAPSQSVVEAGASRLLWKWGVFLFFPRTHLSPWTTEYAKNMLRKDLSKPWLQLQIRTEVWVWGPYVPQNMFLEPNFSEALRSVGVAEWSFILLYDFHQNISLKSLSL